MTGCLKTMNTLWQSVQLRDRERKTLLSAAESELGDARPTPNPQIAARRLILPRFSHKWENNVPITDSLQWQKSSYCTNANCVEVARVAGNYFIRDSKNPAATPLRLTADEWSAFIESIAEVEFPSP